MGTNRLGLWPRRIAWSRALHDPIRAQPSAALPPGPWCASQEGEARQPHGSTAAGARGCVVAISVTNHGNFGECLPDWQAFLARYGHAAMYCDPSMVDAISRGLRQTPYFIEARADNQIVGVLSLIFMKSLLFGRFLVSLPYTSWAGAVAEDDEIARRLVDRAIVLATDLDAQYLELRHLHPVRHPALVEGVTCKVQMRLPLSDNADDNWRELKSEIRTQIRKAIKNCLDVSWGGCELLEDFYAIFACNMRDLGTPVFPVSLFRNILKADPSRVEIGVVRLRGKPLAACLAVHGQGLTEIPSAAVLREHRNTAANSLLYWRAIERATERRQKLFDFGRSTPGSATFTFKKRWGAQASRVVWQYYLRKGDTQRMRPETRRFRYAIRLWQLLPVTATRLLGPIIVRGIP
jgi:FemAB-related protein (PEP-CTERM system-associated)